MTSAECIKLAGLYFTVEKAPLFASVGKELTREEITLNTDIKKVISERDGLNTIYHNTKLVDTNFATYRTDTQEVFGVVGSRYEVIQNLEAFSFFDSIIGEGHAAYETAGALGNGETIFITAKLPSKLIVSKEDIDKYLLFTMAHDGSGSIQVMFTPIRVVCNNTLSAAINSNTNKVVIRHTKNARKRLELATEVLGISEKQSLQYEEVFNLFTKVKMSDADLNTYIDYVFEFDDIPNLSTQSKNKRDNILEYYETGVGQDTIKGTLWGAYNAVTGYLSNGLDRDEDTAFKNGFLKSDVSIRNAAMYKGLQLIS